MQLANYIDGKWQQGENGDFSAYNPADLEVYWQAPAATNDQVNKAVAAARKAQPMWSRLDFTERLSYLLQFQQELEKQRDLIVDTIVMETGKPRWEASQEVGGMIAKLDISLHAKAERCPNKDFVQNNIHAKLKHKPHGVMAVFGPFNFPGHLPLGHMLPALLSGNTIVLKPSELTPLTGERLIELFAQADLPVGVVNLVQGGSDVGIALTNDPQVDAVLFTGSWPTGQKIAQALSAQPHKLLALEMGGNNPLVVWDAENISAIAYNIIQSAFISAGQRCTCARRLFLPQTAIADDIISELITMTGNFIIGPGDQEPEPFMGPLITVEAQRAAIAAQKQYKQAGGKILLTAEAGDAAFISPSIIDMSKAKSDHDQETFAPLLKIYRASSLTTAIAEANATSYGLSAGLFSDNPQLFEDFYHNIRAGIINFNRPLTGASSALPFGGVGQSGNHRPSAYYAADYCSYPTATLYSSELQLPEKLAPGFIDERI